MRRLDEAPASPWEVAAWIAGILAILMVTYAPLMLVR